jgi:hypothetical protein
VPCRIVCQHIEGEVMGHGIRATPTTVQLRLSNCLYSVGSRRTCGENLFQVHPLLVSLVYRLLVIKFPSISISDNISRSPPHTQLLALSFHSSQCDVELANFPSTSPHTAVCTFSPLQYYPLHINTLGSCCSFPLPNTRSQSCDPLLSLTLVPTLAKQRPQSTSRLHFSITKNHNACFNHLAPGSSHSRHRTVLDRHSSS